MVPLPFMMVLSPPPLGLLFETVFVLGIFKGTHVAAQVPSVLGFHGLESGFVFTAELCETLKVCATLVVKQKNEKIRLNKVDLTFMQSRFSKMV